jgi:biopolymer transport protein ExbD
MNVVHQRGFARVRSNMTPMIDVVFLLMIFFMLVAQIQRTQRVDMELPGIDSAAASDADTEDAVVINVVPDNMVRGAGGRFTLGTTAYGDDEPGIDALAAAVRRAVERRQRVAGEAGVSVQLRADRRQSYDAVRPAIEALSRAGVRRAELIVERPSRAGGGTR